MGINSKAVEARERKVVQKKVVAEKAAKAVEDAHWADDDKSLARKKSKKEEEERKKAEFLRKKAENRALLEQEMSSIKTSGKPSIQKVTQAQIRSENDKRIKVVESISKPKVSNISVVKSKKHNKIEYFDWKVDVNLINEEPLTENLNQLEPDIIEASGIDQAIAALR